MSLFLETRRIKSKTKIKADGLVRRGLYIAYLTNLRHLTFNGWLWLCAASPPSPLVRAPFFARLFRSVPFRLFIHTFSIDVSANSASLAQARQAQEGIKSYHIIVRVRPSPPLPKSLIRLITIFSFVLIVTSGAARYSEILKNAFLDF